MLLKADVGRSSGPRRPVPRRNRRDVQGVVRPGSGIGAQPGTTGAVLWLQFLTIVPVLLTADPTEACGRRRWRRCPCPCPSPWTVVCSVPVAPVEHFTSITGRVYRISFSREPQYEFEQPGVFPPDVAPPGPDDYIGNDRGKAKTSIASGPQKSYDALGKLLEDLPDDQKMLQHDWEFVIGQRTGPFYRSTRTIPPTIGRSGSKTCQPGTMAERSWNTRSAPAAPTLPTSS